MKNRIRVMSFVIVICSSNVCAAQVEFNLPEGLSNVVDFFPMNETHSYALISFEESENLFSTRVSRIENGQNDLNYPISNSVPLTILPEEESLYIVYEQEEGLWLVKLDASLDELATVPLQIPLSSHFYAATLVDDQLFIASNLNGIVHLSLLNLDGSLEDSVTMPEFTIPFPTYQTFVEQTGENTLLLSLQCDRTCFIDINDLSNSQWIEIDFSNCLESNMIYSPLEGGSFASLTSLSTLESDFTSVFLISHNQQGEFLTNAVISADTDLVHTDAEIVDENLAYISGLRLEYEDGFISNSDFIFYSVNLNGVVQSNFTYETEEYRENAIRFEESEQFFWFYGSRGLNSSPDEYEAFVMEISKEEVMSTIEVKETTPSLQMTQELGRLTIHSANGEQFEATLLDLSGRIIASKTGSRTIFNTSNYSTGMYILGGQLKGEVVTFKVWID